MRKEQPGEISEILPRVLKSRKPLVIDVIINPDEIPSIERLVQGLGELNAGLDYL